MKYLLVLMILFSQYSFAQYPKSYIVDDTLKWNKKEISVCWESRVLEEKEVDLNLDKPLQKYIRDIQYIVNSQITIEKVGINFVGWDRCSGKESLYDVKLNLFAGTGQRYSTINGSATIGNDKEDHPEVEIDYKYSSQDGHIKKLTQKNHFQMVALHEFAHIAGLYHQEDGSDPFTLYELDEEYDRNSIMSYKLLDHLEEYGLSFLQDKTNQIVFADQNNAKLYSTVDKSQSRVEVKVALSSGDINALRCLYVYKEEQKEALCQGVIIIE